MKYHNTLDQCFEEYWNNSHGVMYLLSGISKESAKQIFEEGWLRCAIEINNGLDSDHVQEELTEYGFLKEDTDD